MANPGNSGQRYKLQKFASVAVEDDMYVRMTLTCGHSTRANWNTPRSAQWAYEAGLKDIEKGVRTRCTQCKVR